ncbi:MULTISPECIES: RNA-binding cell elongation regulator Jag/EloR [unclassified Veillonella]|uniref:RNA-binding cell elongation regulator Jag/EloR n=1 Tax=unclassified Veillonella TaxID=2630086 RepID=UPI00021A1F49|nr:MULTISPECIES: RNA-binding cell elongation regulator Jag/EloR [unclassified Veillonella]EGS33501.1 R3H domain protein [Veillonella sp. oral taxon 780 str. F0422]
MDYIEVSAKTIEEATSQATAQIESQGRVVTSVKVLEEPSKGFLGFGKKDALVRVYFEEGTAENIAVAEEVVSVVETVTESMVDTVETETTEIPVVVEDGITKAEQDFIADTGKEFLLGMFGKMGLSVQIEKLTTKDKITFQVHGEDLGILIGKHGQTLDAIQYLTNLVANKEVRRRCQIVVDVENYRSRREETLVQLAHRLGAKVRRTRQKIALEPMNAFERKIIHLALQNEKNIKTDSEGQEPYRHIVIYYKR